MRNVNRYAAYFYGAEEVSKGAPEEGASPKKAPEKPEEKGLKLQEIKISFSAPPKNVQETFNIKEKKEFEQNFQWVKYAVVVSNEQKTKWYTYIFTLEPWGTRQKAAPELYASDHKGNKLEGQPLDVTPDEIEKKFSKLLSKPVLDPDLPESMITYLNAPFDDPSTKKKIIDPKGKYTPTEFKNTFEDAKTETGVHFYILITKSGELKTPFGKKSPEGQVAPPKSKGPEEVAPKEGIPPAGTPAGAIPETIEKKGHIMENTFRSAVKAAQEKKSQISGGFDIMRKLFYKQHEEQKEKQKKKKSEK